MAEQQAFAKELAQRQRDLDERERLFDIKMANDLADSRAELAKMKAEIEGQVESRAQGKALALFEAYKR